MINGDWIFISTKIKLGTCKNCNTHNNYVSVCLRKYVGFFGGQCKNMEFDHFL